MTININIKSKIIGEITEDGNQTTRLIVEYDFDGYLKEVDIPVFNPSSDDDLAITIMNRCVSELRAYQNGQIIIE